MAVVLSSSRSNSPRSSSSSNSSSSFLWRQIGPSWLLFLLGCVLGHFHGRYYNELSQPFLAPIVLQVTDCATDASSSPQQPPPSSCLPGNGNGWSSIQVFYGQADYLSSDSDSVENVQIASNSTIHSTASATAVAVDQRRRQLASEQPSQQQIQHRWYGQARQDELVYALLRNRTNGFFIDLAANDAVLLSNTYALETFHHWQGVCIEPNPIYWYNLTLRRPHCTIIGAVVGGAERLQQPVHFRFEAGDHGGIADAGFDNGKRWQKSSELRYTVPLLEILRQRVPGGGAPTDIDYLSLDVEGTSWLVHT